MSTFDLNDDSLNDNEVDLLDEDALLDAMDIPFDTADELDEDADPIEKPDLDSVIAAIEMTDGKRLDATILYGLSRLDEAGIDRLEPVWSRIDVEVKRAIMRGVVESAENDIMLDYRSLALMVLGDADPRVRELAIDALWEDETIAVMDRLIRLAKTDENRDVRASAASALGRFVTLGEMDDNMASLTEPARAAVLDLWNNEGEEISVRRRALEAIANGTLDSLPGMIDAAYNSVHHEMRVSAVFAMGRSCDSRWASEVVEELNSSDPELRYEAARAAGELMIADAVQQLAQLVLEEDREIALVSVWSLGEIGGMAATRVLEALLDKAEADGDDDLVMAVEDALGNASLAWDLGEDLMDDDI